MIVSGAHQNTVFLAPFFRHFLQLGVFRGFFFIVADGRRAAAAGRTTEAVSAPRPRAAAALPTVVASPERLPRSAPGRFPQLALPGQPSQPRCLKGQVLK